MDRYNDNSFFNNTKLVRKIGFLAIIILLILISLGIYLFIKNSFKEEMKVELSNDSEEVLNTYGYFNVINSIYDCSSEKCFGFFLGKEKMKEEDIPFVSKAYIALNKYYKENNIDSIPKEISTDILDKSLKNIFGRGYTYDDKLNVVVNGAVYSYDDRNRSYKLQELGSGGLDNKILVRQFVKAYKTEKRVEVYEKVGLVNFTADNRLENMYVEVYNNDKLLEKLKVSMDYDLSTFKIDKYIDKLDIYKWTFTKKFNGDYIFESVEKQNN